MADKLNTTSEMGKNKLKKFAEMEQMQCVLQYPFARLAAEGFPHSGRWGENVFKRTAPLVLELGCGKGEYTVGLARRFADKNFIGIDIKGARIYTGARQATEQNLGNAAFLRTDIELLPRFFAPGEVSEIWITFPDPQMQKTRRRLTSTRFLNLYRQILAPGGTIHLKTDSPFLSEYTRRLLDANGIVPQVCTFDLYGDAATDADVPPYVKEIHTFYEQQWLSRGKKIRYIAFTLPTDATLVEPREDDIERDDYHSYPRGVVQGMPAELEKLHNTKA